MTSARQCRVSSAGILSRLSSMLWLATALSVLQWTPTPIDPHVFVRLMAGHEHDAGLAVTDRSSSPAVEARAGLSATLGEKRSSAGQSAPVATGDTATIFASWDITPDVKSGSVLIESVPIVARTIHHSAFTARSPPLG
ncbi:hypothetical protein [Thalassobaculum sp.]|uniref:hypothetical protein n=1 Tax=Thalassobaculum sp. TaxID=2022740 RepID=UPI0032EBFCC6